MYTVRASELQSSEVYAPGAVGAHIQWLLDESHGAPTFAMRRFVIDPGGSTPRHSHDWEHEVYVLSGKGIVLADNGQTALEPGMAVLVLPNEEHQFQAAEDNALEFLCLVPNGPATVH